MFIHTADLHLDSALSILPKDKSAERKDELVVTFGRMVEYAKSKGAVAVLIAGDLFDTDSVAQQESRIMRQVSSIIMDASGIDFLYLRGNHDAMAWAQDDKPGNLKTFCSDKWTSYTYGDVVVTGRETGSGAIDAMVYADLTLDAEKTNIVMLHGKVVSGWNAASAAGNPSGDNASIIDLTHLANKGIDYLALGHIHKRQKGQLGNTGTWCYPGCLEGRGFDECGEKGFVKLTIDDKAIKRAFVPCAKRSIHEVTASLKGSLSFDEIKKRIDEAIAPIPQKDIVKVVLRGGISEDTYIDIASYLPLFANRLYFLRIYNETERVVDYDKYVGDVSLKGCFIRKVLADNTISAHDKGEVIHMGISALSGRSSDLLTGC